MLYSEKKEEIDQPHSHLEIFFAWACAGNPGGSPKWSKGVWAPVNVSQKA